jgi:PAS domain S-box-containing protein
MTGSIHRGTASEPQDRSSSAAHSIEVPPEIVRKWQEFVNLLAEIMHVPSASIMRVDPPHIKVFVSSTSKGNPCEPGALDTGPYCETVMKTGQPLLVPDARENEAWKANPHVRLGMISYLGFPIGWPDGRLFGTICVRDNKRNEYSEAYLKLLLHFRDMLQADLKSFATLHQHEAKIRRLVDSNIIGIFVWDFDGRILEANDELLRMVSYDREDLVSGRVRWADLTPPDWRDRNNARIEQQKSSGRFEPFEKEFTRKDGSRVPILIGGATFEEGGDQGVAFVLDLTERKCAEEALRESERSARSALDGIAGLVAIMTPNGEVETVNRQCVEYFGRPVEEQRDWVTTDMVHPEDLPQMLENFKRAIASEIPYHFEQRLRRFDGEYRWFETRGGAVRDDTGRIVRWYVLLTDIEDRKRAEEASRGSEAKFRDYAESASDWYWETDPDHKFTHLTEDERRLARGVATVSRIGVARWEFATDVQSEPEKWELHRSMLEARQPFRDFVYRATHSDGSVVYNKISGKPVFDANGEFRGYRGTGTDVTALRTAEGEARESERRYREAQVELAHANRVATMGQLTSSIAHEVNQPIAAAVTYASAARRFLSAEPPNFREVDDALSLIIKEGNRAGEVVGRIRALIKKAPARKDAVEINDAILEVIALTRTEAANNGISVRTQLAEGLPRVQGDRVQLQQVLLNLIINAIEAMRDIGEGERELLISSRNEPDGVSVEVRDSGPGFASAALERAFEAFYTTKPGGLGLGLSICRSIIDAHGGRLWATRCEPRGALFQFTIPADRAAIREVIE